MFKIYKLNFDFKNAYKIHLFPCLVLKRTNQLFNSIIVETINLNVLKDSVANKTTDLETIVDFMETKSPAL